MKYILVILINSYVTGDVDIEYIEFNSALSCQVAATSVVVQMHDVSSGTKINTVCVAKGVDRE